MKTVIIISFLILPFVSFAQGINIDLKNFNVPEPVENLFNTFSKIRVNFDSISFFRNAIGEAGKAISAPADFISGITNIWDRFNDWLESTIGVSFREVLRALFNFLVWVLELFIKLIKIVLPTI